MKSGFRPLFAFFAFICGPIRLFADRRKMGDQPVASQPSGTLMTIIKQDDLIQSVADALQYISYYHPADYIRNLASAYEKEQSPAAKDAMAQILINSRLCAEGHRPICQDTGIVTVFLKIGMDIRWDGATMGVEDMV